MASGWYNNGLSKVLDGTIDLDTSTIKCMLIDSTYTFDGTSQDQNLIDDGGASDLVDTEISVTGYTAGFGGAGRKTVTVALTVDDAAANGEVDVQIAGGGTTTWTSLGSGATIGGAALVFETGGADTASIPLIFFDVTNTATNGGDVTLDWDATANATFTCTRA